MKILKLILFLCGLKIMKWLDTSEELSFVCGKLI